MTDDGIRQLIATFRDVTAREFGYQEEGAWHNNRIKGLAFKTGTSHGEIWVQMYSIGKGARKKLHEPVHFQGGNLNLAYMLEQTVQWAELTRGL